jgi:hypothetical protein
VARSRIGDRDLEEVGRDGAIAQLGERLLCKQEVVGSIPSGSTRPKDQRDQRPTSKSTLSPLQSGGFLDIVKKGYARDAGQRPRHLWAFGVPSVVASHTGACAAGREIGECANRTLRLGLSRCKLVFLEAVFTSRDGRVCVGANAPAFPQVLKVGIANESDQVT